MNWFRKLFASLISAPRSGGDIYSLTQSNLDERMGLLNRAATRAQDHGPDSLINSIRSDGTEYQSEGNFIYCINRSGVVLAHSISNSLAGADLRKQLNGEPLKILERILSDPKADVAGQVHYSLNPRVRVEMSYRRIGEIIVIAQSKLIPAKAD